jgi:hypothetical protein
MLLVCKAQHFETRIFKSLDKLIAQYFADIDPRWPEKPVGPLASRWSHSDQYSICYLIHVATVLRVLRMNVVGKSIRILREKAQELLRPPSQAAFEETLIELEVGAAMTNWTMPIWLEPLVPDGLAPSAPKPSSPDYAIKLPDADVTVEVTVWHWQRIQAWDRLRKELTKRLEVKLSGVELRRNLRIELPLDISNDDLSTLTNPLLLERIVGEPGELVIATGGGDATIQWSDTPHFDSFESFKKTRLPEGVDMAVTGPIVIKRALGFSFKPIIDDTTFGAIVASLRKAIDRKSRQRHASAPHVLAMALGHHRLHWDWLTPLFAERIFPNNKYKWISALCAFTPQRGWRANSPLSNCTFTWNENAAILVPKSLHEIAENGATYRLWSQI